MSDWWAKQLSRVQQTVQAPSSSPVPRKAVRWEANYPPVRPREEDLYPGEEGELDVYRQVQREGFIKKPPPSKSAVGVCPECGGTNFFKRRWANTECAPLCTDCGYNGDFFTQTGSLLNSIGVRSQGPLHFARSDNPTGESQLDWSNPIHLN